MFREYTNHVRKQVVANFDVLTFSPMAPPCHKHILLQSSDVIFFLFNFQSPETIFQTCALGWDTQPGIKIVEAIALLWQENGTLNLIYEGVYFFQKEDNWSSMIMNAKRGLGVGVI